MLLHLSFGIHDSHLDSVVPLSKWSLQIFMLWEGSTAALFYQLLPDSWGDRQTVTGSSSFTSPFIIHKEKKKFKNRIVIHQGNWKPSKDPAKSPSQFLVRHKVQIWLLSSLQYVSYLFTKFAMPLVQCVLLWCSCFANVGDCEVSCLKDLFNSGFVAPDLAAEDLLRLWAPFCLSQTPVPCSPL